jgi:hypothetical protein
VSTEKSKPKPAAPAAVTEAVPPAADPAGNDTIRITRNNTGRVKFDDRGNAIWEWAVNTGSFALEPSTARLKKLENHALALADEPPPSTATGPVQPNPKGAVLGYSPYDSGILNKTEPPRKKTDLRRLGEFYKLKKQANRNKDGES